MDYTDFIKEDDIKVDKPEKPSKGKMSKEDFIQMKNNERRNVQPKKPNKDEFYKFSRDIAAYTSEELPDDMKDKVKELSTLLNNTGHVLRASNGPDKLENYLISTGLRTKYYLPWKTKDSTLDPNLIEVPELTIDMYATAKYFSGYNKDNGRDYSMWEEKIRNPIAYSIRGLDAVKLLGKDLKTPVRFIIAYTPDGITSIEEGKRSSSDHWKSLWDIMKIAEEMEIPFFNIRKDSSFESLKAMINS